MYCVGVDSSGWQKLAPTQSIRSSRIHTQTHSPLKSLRFEHGSSRSRWSPALLALNAHYPVEIVC